MGDVSKTLQGDGSRNLEEFAKLANSPKLKPPECNSGKGLDCRPRVVNRYTNIGLTFRVILGEGYGKLGRCATWLTGYHGGFTVRRYSV